MSGKNWTPAPWNVRNTADIFTDLGSLNADDIESPSNDAWHIADCDMGGLGLYEAKANADLISAAPDLYEALEMVMKINMGEHELQDRLQFSTYGRNILDTVNAAMAKARGETK